MESSGGKLNCDLPMGKEMVLHSGFGADMELIFPQREVLARCDVDSFS
jgi:hypothetical protein